MSKSKRRPHSQDFSEATHGRITDSSFAPACDVNNIVRHYESTGIDPYAHRVPLARYEDATTISFEDAMRNKAELDSAFEDQPAHVRASRADSVAWATSVAQLQATPEAPSEPLITPPVEPLAPQGPTSDRE